MFLYIHSGTLTRTNKTPTRKRVLKPFQRPMKFFQTSISARFTTRYVCICICVCIYVCICINLNMYVYVYIYV